MLYHAYKTKQVALNWMEIQLKPSCILIITIRFTSKKLKQTNSRSKPKVFVEW
jgi:hypothetical protein